jgi:hypothetical protein
MNHRAHRNGNAVGKSAKKRVKLDSLIPCFH